MKKITKALVFGLALQLGTSVYAQSRPEAVSSEIKSYEENHDFEMIPDCEYTQMILDNRVEKTIVPFVSEMSYKVKKNGSYSIKDTAKILTSISTMKGITYYSTTRKKEAVLYKSAGFIDNLESRKPVQDYALENSDGQTFYTEMDDKSFGKMIYQMDYHQNENTIYLRLSNPEVIGAGPVKAIMPGNMVINLIVIDEGEYFQIYLGTDVNMKKISGMQKQICDSLQTRMDAIYKWLLTQY